MKHGFIIWVAMAAFVLASCGEADVTRITGVVNDTTVTAFRITLPSHSVDTTVEVREGKFQIELPADRSDYGVIIDQSRKYGTYYISDGTRIKMTFEDGDISVEAASKKSLEAVYDEYVSDIEAIADAGHYDLAKEMEPVIFETVRANPDNAVAVLVMLDAMYVLEPEAQLQLIDFMQDPIRSSKFILAREKEAQAQLDTKEGEMFTDFTVNTVVGYTRSMNPEPIYKEVKFSDYVGKGKYVLVDFWSPWCGPCRREVPNIIKVYDKYKKKGLDVLSIAVWERKPQSHTIEVAGELGMDWHHINNAGSVPTEIYGIGGIPHLMLIGPDGTILKRGFHGLDGIQAVVGEYLK